MIDLQRRDSLTLQSKGETKIVPNLPIPGRSHEIDFLYRRVSEYQTVMDEVLRMPYMNEPEVRDIIGKVYHSNATRVTNKQLQLINMHRIEKPARETILP